MANETLREGGAAPTLLDPGTGTATRPAAVTRREPGPIPGSSAAATLHENPVPRTPVAGVRVVVPELLRERYQVTRQLPTKGAEADILLADDAQLQRQVILKLYRPGIVPKTEVLEKVLATAPEHVIQLYDHGQAEGIYYEVMEYAQHGSLRDLIKAPLPPEQALSVLKELHAALAHLHQHQIIHRDIKPDNILVRHRDPLDLILTDFGLSSINEATHRMTTANRTAQYAAPEAIDGKVNAKSDWWSLGIIMLETLLGKTPFDGMAVQAINSYLRNHPIEFDGVADPRWLTLLHGLLNRNEDVRWGGTEVTRWLAGETVPVVEDVGTRQGNAQQTDSHRPYILAGSPYATPKALAGGLAQHWDEGVKHLTRGLILTWVREEVKDYDLASFMMDLAENRDSPDIRLVKLIQRLDPDLPPIWKGIDASPQGVLDLAKAAQNDPQQRMVLSEFLNAFRVSSRGIDAFKSQELKDLARRHDEARKAYEQSWSRLKQIAKVAVTAPQFDDVLPLLVVVTEEPKALESLRQHEILNLNEDAKACPWFAEMGKLEEADMATLLVMANVKNAAAEWERDRKRKLKAEEEQQEKNRQAELARSAQEAEAKRKVEEQREARERSVREKANNEREILRTRVQAQVRNLLFGGFVLILASLVLAWTKPMGFSSDHPGIEVIRAAMEGEPGAMNNMGVFYESGVDEMSYEDETSFAAAWFLASALNGNDIAIANLRSMRKYNSDVTSALEALEANEK